MELEDIKKLAKLSRLDMTDEEMKGIAHDFEGILAYVDQVKEASKLIPKDQKQTEALEKDYNLINVMREDIPTENPGEYRESIINEMPESVDGYLKVKQIL